MKRYFLLILALLCAPTAANALLSCSVTATAVNFGSPNPIGAGTYDIVGNISLYCTGSQNQTVAACVDLAMGDTDSQGHRLIYDGSATVPVQLFQNSSRSLPWGTAALGQAPILQRAGDGWINESFMPASTFRVIPFQAHTLQILPSLPIMAR